MRRKEVPLRGDSKGRIPFLWSNAPQNLSIRLEEKFSPVAQLDLPPLVELATTVWLMSAVNNSEILAMWGLQGLAKKPCSLCQISV